ncbi:hypothetical protein ERC79_11740 [Rhodococcus sp. ABRD24]|uniref:hypothetical protein n=1 Tax=Rhodococcus sp. ABRD24 TaxID=2507582 RepID=UPI0010387B1C|nr:hypothetical protein [Rhodococcus sp. ABRD24]QBJ96559.1 hypothetical protein ERC79_11740 [Rhodococcus sp. ABRD24]
MNTQTKSLRRSRPARAALVGSAVAASMALVAPTAAAAPDPVTVPVPGGAVCDPVLTEACLSVVVRSGTFANNGFTLPIGDGDMIIAGNLGDVDFIPRDDGSNGVYSKPLTVPGGVLGVDLPFNNLFGLAAVTSTVEAVDVPMFNGIITDYDITLPVRLKIDNPFLGGNCYIGSEDNPVVFELDKSNPMDDLPTTDITTPYPAGTAAIDNVQNTATDFALPGASGCGPFGVLNPIVNWRAKVPNDTGTLLKTKATGFLFPATAGGTDPLDGSGGDTGSGGSSGS